MALPEGPPLWPIADESVREAMLAAFADGSWGRYHGRYLEQWQHQLVVYHGVTHAITCCSGTIAVELALRGLQIGAEDEVILAGYDFSGNFRSIEAVGARPVLVDIDPDSSGLDAGLVESAIGPQTRAIIVSHLHGGIVSMRTLREIADRRGLRLIEDACQIPGGRVEGRVAGTWGDVGVLSFGGSKLLTAGRGGAIITCDDSIAQRIKIFRERGNDAFPMSELQAAVLIPQLDLLGQRNALRRANAKQLALYLNELPGLTPLIQSPPDSHASFYKLGVLLDESAVGVSREQIVVAMQAEGVALDVGFRGFSRRGTSRCRRVGELPNSIRAAGNLMVLHHPVLLEPEATIRRVELAFQKVITAFAAGG